VHALRVCGRRATAALFETGKRFSDTKHEEEHPNVRDCKVLVVSSHLILRSFPDNTKVHLGYGFVGFKDGEQVALFERCAPDVREGEAATGELLEAPFDLLVGADGVSSNVRSQLLKKEEAGGAPPGEWCGICSRLGSSVKSEFG
jgi:2-polyprenyl-6-methoxyphenol hydroxylase-like FAD-dependent oxidoreductase